MATTTVKKLNEYIIDRDNSRLIDTLNKMGAALRWGYHNDIIATCNKEVWDSANNYDYSHVCLVEGCNSNEIPFYKDTLDWYKSKYSKIKILLCGNIMCEIDQYKKKVKDIKKSSPTLTNGTASGLRIAQLDALAQMSNTRLTPQNLRTMYSNLTGSDTV